MNYKVEHRQSHEILVSFRNNKGLNWTNLKCNTPTQPEGVQESFYECNCTLDCLNWYSYNYSSFISLICTVCFAHLSWHLTFFLILFFTFQWQNIYNGWDSKWSWTYGSQFAYNLWFYQKGEWLCWFWSYLFLPWSIQWSREIVLFKKFTLLSS